LSIQRAGSHQEARFMSGENSLISFLLALTTSLAFVSESRASGIESSALPASKADTIADSSRALCGGLLKADCVVDPPRPGIRAKVWGFAEMPVYAIGSRMAPNGILFDPLFALNLDFNFEVIPNKKLYVFTESKFWMQRPGAGITNPSQGNLDFSKRELDFVAGAAWNYVNNLELRVAAYGLNNLNRGVSLSSPSGFQDGVLIENRFYFNAVDKYDIGKLNFVSVGYFPTKSLVGGNGESFKPSFWARGYFTYDVPFWNSYLYADAQLTAERAISPRLLELDFGLAMRPFERVPYVEVRVGSDLTTDVKDKVTRDLLYAAVRLTY
jgi:hypothetical protein